MADFGKTMARTFQVTELVPPAVRRWVKRNPVPGRLMMVLTGGYRPELHYMRGPGPKWFKRHGDPANESPSAEAWLKECD